MLIHGGNSDLSSLYPLTKLLHKNNINSLSFNLSGLSNTGIENSSILTNINESIVFYENLKKVDMLIGYSLGGYIAIKLALKFKIKKLILLCPAIYSDQAINKKYGFEFKKEISKPYSYNMSSVWSYLDQYENEILIIYGSLDGIKTKNGQSKGFYYEQGITKYSPIPYDVMLGFKNLSINNQNIKFKIEKNIDHYLIKNLDNDNTLFIKILKFITK